MADLQDPLESYTGLSLFPRTFSTLPNLPLSRDSDYLNSFHSLQMSLPVQNPEKLMDQAKNILDNTEIPIIRMTSDNALKEKDEVVDEMAVQYPRGQRPGLQRKRARFSLLPSISLPTVNLESTLDFDKDPEEYFLAFERRQNAQKELARQTGSSFTSSDQYNVFKVPRSERPGIPGRSKKAKYKHLYSSLLSQNSSEDVLSHGGLQKETSQPDLASQETEPENVESPQLESTNIASELTEPETAAAEEMEINGSIAVAEKTVDQLLSELLADGYGDLEGDRAINLLEEHLQIKTLHLKKLNLPEMENVPKLDFKPPEVNLPKSRNILSDINNLFVGIKSATPMKLKDMETFVPNFGSPTPPKSPLASLSLLKKRMFQSNPIRDAFSSINIGQSPSLDVSPLENINKCSDPGDSGKSCSVSDKLNSLTTKEDDAPLYRRNSTELATEDSTSSFEKHVNGNSSRLGSGSEIDTKESGSELEGNGVGICNEFMNENINREDAHKDGLDDLGDMVHDVNGNSSSLVSGSEIDARESGSELEGNGVGICNEFMNVNINWEVSQVDHHKDGLDGLGDMVQDVNGTLSSLGSGSEIDTRESGSDLEGNRVGIFNEFMNENRNSENAQIDHHKDGLDDLGDTVQDPDAEASAEPNENTDYSHVDTSKSNQNELEPAVAEDQQLDGGSAEYADLTSVQNQDLDEQTQATSSELQTERMMESSVRSMNEVTKEKSGPPRERRNKNLLKRQSLADCGLSWETGVRRSTRIKSRPLEYWRGERFLYGRIHQGLPTVIGIKYESPGKGSGPTLKVKSFVSEEHKHLVDQAALG